MSLTDQIVVFLDLLGFRAKMVESRDPTRAKALLEEYDKVMGKALDNLESNSRGRFQYKGFTDNIVLSTPLSDRFHPEERFGVVINALAEFQLELTLNGWFVRGGIAVGPFYMDERIVFGPALIDAYELESRFARDPRIVLSDTAKNYMRSFLEFYAEKETAPQTFDVLIDQDGRAYVNYLIVGHNDSAPQNSKQIFVQHKRQIENALQSHRADPPVWNKYRWLAMYHNYFIDAWYKDYRDELEISDDVLRPVPESLLTYNLPPDFLVPWES